MKCDSQSKGRNDWKQIIVFDQISKSNSKNPIFFVTTGRYGSTQNIWSICRPGLSKLPISRHPDRALFLPSNVCAYMFRKPSHILGNFPASFHFSSAPPTGPPESQKPPGSQIIRFCMGLYLKIDKMVTVRPGKIKIPSAGIDGGKSTDTKPDSQGCLGKAFAHFTKKGQENYRSLSRGFWKCGVATKPRATPSVVHCEEERFNRSTKLKFFSYFSCPLEAMAWCLELNWHFQGRKIYSLCSSILSSKLTPLKVIFYRPTPLPSGISWASDPPPPRNFQLPPWWGYEYFQEPHNIGFWGQSLKMA